MNPSHPITPPWSPEPPISLLDGLLDLAPWLPLALPLVAVAALAGGLLLRTCRARRDPGTLPDEDPDELPRRERQ